MRVCVLGLFKLQLHQQIMCTIVRCKATVGGELHMAKRREWKKSSQLDQSQRPPCRSIVNPLAAKPGLPMCWRYFPAQQLYMYKKYWILKHYCIGIKTAHVTPVNEIVSRGSHDRVNMIFNVLAVLVYT